MATGKTLGDRTGKFSESGAGGEWRLVTDAVMGGLSSGTLEPDRRLDQDCLRLRGTVDTANNGGFIQMTLDLAGGGTFDASDYSGLLIRVAGNGEHYNLHLRTADLWLPWQSYRVSFRTTPEWRDLYIRFEDFTAYRTSRTFDPSRLKRIGVVAIGRDFQADLCVAMVRLYRSEDLAESE